MTNVKYKRVLLKLSGEALIGKKDYGIDGSVITSLANQIHSVYEDNVELIIVLGGGNFYRGSDLEKLGIQRVTADHMGMLATIMNSLAMQDALERIQVHSRVMSALKINQVCEDYIRRRAVRHLEKGRVVVLAAGTGNPFFTTDSAASLRAIEINAELLIKATKVDGVYSSDPAKNDDAVRYETLTYDEVIERKLSVMDTTAVVLCRDNLMPLRILDMRKSGVLLKVAMGGSEGTLVNN